MIVAIDVETTLFRDLGRVPTERDVTDLVCLSYAYDDGDSGVLSVGDDEDNIESFLLGFLVGAGMGEVTLVFHNAPFDIAVLCKAFPSHIELWKQAIRDRRIRDTCPMFSFRCITPSRSLSLQYAVWKTLGIWMEKSEVRTSFRPGEPLTDEQRIYAEKDAVFTLALYQRLIETSPGALTEIEPQHVQPKVICPLGSDVHMFGVDPADGEGLDAVYSAACAWKAFTLEATGIGVDMDTCRELAAVAQADMDAVRDELLELRLTEWTRNDKVPPEYVITGTGEGVTRRWVWREFWQAFVRFDGTNTVKQPRRIKMCMAPLRAAYTAAAEALELEDVPRSEKTGELSLDYKYWNQFRKELPPGCAAHMRWQKAQKLMGTYFKPLLAKSGVSTPCLQAGALLGSQSNESEPERYETCDPQCEPCAPSELEEASSPRQQSSGDGSGQHETAARGERLTVYGSYGIGFAETGRWTSWKLNLQNQPKPLRGMYVAPHLGWLLVSADYKALEMYTLCQTLESFGLRGKLYETLKSGGDIHTVAAAMIHGVPESDVSPAMRQGAKACNFGLPGGMGCKRFHSLCRQGYGLDWTFSEAASARELWFDAFPEVAEFLAMFKLSPSLEFRPMGMSYKTWLEEIGLDPEESYTSWDLGRHLNDGRLYDVTLPSGRRFPNRRYSQAANIYFQGPGAEIVTRAFVKLCDHGEDVVAVVHDSITCQSEPECAKGCASWLAKCMLEAQAEVCPDLAEFLPVPEVEISERWS